MGVFDKMKAAAGAVVSKAGELLSSGVDKLKATLDEITATSPYLKEVGYRVTDLELHIALSPGVTVLLVREFEAGEEAFQAILATHAEHKVFCSLVKLLQQANQIHTRVGPKDRRFEGLIAELGVPPVIRLRYVEPKDAPAAVNA